MQQQLNGDTGPETDLQDLVVRSNVEQLDDLRCGISIHARHDDPTQPSQDALRTAEHAHQELAHPCHGFDLRRNNGSRRPFLRLSALMIAPLRVSGRLVFFAPSPASGTYRPIPPTAPA